MKLKNVADVYALSPVQQLMLTHAMAGAGHDTMRELLTCTLSGRIDRGALRQAWQNIVDRHAALRSAFIWEGLQKPLQVVRQQVELPWREFDWRDLTDEQRDAQWSAWIAADRLDPFELSRAPLMRLNLFRIADDRCRFAWSCHHIVLDGWCLGLILREVLACYEAIRSGQQPRLPEAIPFRAYVAWLAARTPEDEGAFWRRYLADCRGTPRIGLLDESHQLPAGDEPFGETQAVLSAEMSAQLRSFAARQRVTLSTVVESSWCLLLARLTNSPDVVFGSAVSARPPELKGADMIVGPLANAIPVRFRVNKDECWGDSLRRFQAQKADLQGHEHFALDQIQRWIGVESSGPLFSSLIAFENYPLEPSCFNRPGGLQISDLHGTVTSDTPLLLAVMPGPPLQLRLRYRRTDCTDRAAEQLIRHFTCLLEDAVNQAEQRAIDISRSLAPPAFSTAEFQRVIESGQDAWTAAAQERVREFLESHDRATAPKWTGRAMVIDAWNHAALAGVPGELHVECDSGEHGARWIGTGERAARGLDGELKFLGNQNDSAVIRDYRLNADWLCDLICSHALVDKARVAALRKSDGSVQLAAYIVPVAGSQTLLDADQNALLAEEIRRFLTQQVPPDLIPRIVTLTELPGGAPDDMAFPPVVQSRPALDGRYVAPRDFVEQELARIWSDLLGVHPIGIHDNFAELGGRSVLALSLITRIEQRFNRKVPIVALYGQPTIAHLADWLRRSTTSQTSSSLVAIQPQGTRRPLICVHPAGGTVFCYAELSRYLGGEQPVYGLQARGIDGLQSPHTSVAEMAASYVEDIRAQFPSGPYRLCGWSTGGIIAFEVACRLQQLNEPVELLALFDAGMPASRDRAFDKDDLLPMLAMMFPGQSPEELAELQQAGFEKQLEYFQRRAELAQLVVGGAGNAKHVYDVFQANVQAITEHQPSEFSGQLTLFRATMASTPMHRDEFLGWKSRANQISVYEVAGDHVNMFRPPAIQTIASRLSTLLSRP